MMNRKLDKTIKQFNQGCKFLQQSFSHWEHGSFTEQEDALRSAARDIGNSIELALKAFLSTIRREELSEEDRKKLKRNPHFNDLLDMMKRYVDMDLEPSLEASLIQTRNLLRNPATHDFSIPSALALNDGVEAIRNFLKLYLSVDDADLHKVVVPITVDGNIDRNKVDLSSHHVINLSSLPTTPTLKPFDIKTLHTLSDPNGPILHVCFSPDGLTVAAGGGDSCVRLWNVESGMLLREFASIGASSIAYSPDGKTFALTTYHKIYLFCIPTSQITRIIKIPISISPACDLVFSPDGNMIASSGDKTFLWDARTGELIHEFLEIETYVQSICFSEDGNILALASQNIHIWDLEKKRERQQLVGGESGFWSISFSPDSRILAFGGIDGNIRLWDFESKKELKPLVGHNSTVTSLAFSPDGQLLASGGSDKTLRLWDISFGREIQVIGEYSYSVYGVDFNPDGCTLVAATNESLVRMWRLARFNESDME